MLAISVVGYLAACDPSHERAASPKESTLKGGIVVILAGSMGRCAPPRGPGDQAVHSAALRVHGITCAAGRRLALACTRFTYGRSGPCTAIGERWSCVSTKPRSLESAQVCEWGRRSMHILWTD